LFNGVYRTGPARWIVISSDRYLARNEWAIAAAKGHEYHHFFATAEPNLSERKSWLPFHSPFTFDFARDGDALRDAIG
jgi:hypothetical protein